jgi:hypothetical protein
LVTSACGQPNPSETDGKPERRQPQVQDLFIKPKKSKVKRIQELLKDLIQKSHISKLSWPHLQEKDKDI